MLRDGTLSASGAPRRPSPGGRGRSSVLRRLCASRGGPPIPYPGTLVPETSISDTYPRPVPVTRRPHPGVFQCATILGFVGAAVLTNTRFVPPYGASGALRT